MALSPDYAGRNRGSRIINKTIMSEREKFRSGALSPDCTACNRGCRIINENVMKERQNKYLSPADNGDVAYFICFSGAEEFLAIFSQPLIFSLVLSFLSREKKERFERKMYHQSSSVKILQEDCSFSFARPKVNRKERAPCENGSDAELQHRKRPVPLHGRRF